MPRDFGLNFSATTKEPKYMIVKIGVVSGKAIFGPPLEEYWKKKLEEEAAAKENDRNSGLIEWYAYYIEESDEILFPGICVGVGTLIHTRANKCGAATRQVRTIPCHIDHSRGTST
nr:Transmembrane protein [Ipomoea batatas]